MFFSVFISVRMASFVCYICMEETVDANQMINHLKLVHCFIDGNKIKCFKKQPVTNVQCSQEFHSFKTAIQHVKYYKCKLIDKEDNYELSTNETYTRDLHSFFDTIAKNIISLPVTENIKDKIFNILEEVALKGITVNLSLKKKYGDFEYESAMKSTAKFLSEQFRTYSSSYKRSKLVQSDDCYVPSKTIWVKRDQTKQHDGDKNSKNFEYVSVLETIKSVFSDKRFSEIYFEYNTGAHLHQCTPGKYEKYCCGGAYKRNELFKSDKTALQLRLYIDEFETTSPLKTKSHKLLGIYLCISNFPSEHLSKLKNIYLVTLCSSKILKEMGYNKILCPLVDDIKKLEHAGIKTEDGKILKGTLVNVCFDNLGGNGVFGFVESFSALYYCRICKEPRPICQKSTSERPQELRDITHYKKIMENIISMSGTTALDYKKTFGFKNYCVLNDLKFYHILDNRSQDIMHDLAEGVIPLILNKIFVHLKKLKVVVEQEVNKFRFGDKYKTVLPGIIQFNQAKLNLNASQSYCLFIHLPLILWDVLSENKDPVLQEMWFCYEKLLKIVQIVYSHSIREENIVNLEQLIETFLLRIQVAFKMNLTPKCHFLLHYPNSIREMGPLRNIQMIRGEAKHKVFTDDIKRFKNFKNVTKMLATAHQHQILTVNKPHYSMNIAPSVTDMQLRKLLLTNNDLREQKELLIKKFKGIDTIKCKQFLKIDSTTYRIGHFIIYKKSFYNINFIMEHEHEYFFFCIKYDVVKFHDFSNCIEVEKSMNIRPLLFKLTDMGNKNIYERYDVNGKNLIIADTLDVNEIF